MPYTLTVKHNLFCTILQISFCVAKVAQRFYKFKKIYTYIYTIYIYICIHKYIYINIYIICFLVFFLQISIYFFSKCHQLYKINYETGKVIITHGPSTQSPIPLQRSSYILCCRSLYRLNTYFQGTATSMAGSWLYHGHRFGSSDPATTPHAPVSLRRTLGHEDSKGALWVLIALLVWTIWRPWLWWGVLAYYSV